jgi:hypothetical protein
MGDRPWVRAITAVLAASAFPVGTAGAQELRPWIGLLLKDYAVAGQKGAEVTAVHRSGPAASKLIAGEVIVAVGSSTQETRDQVIAALGAYKPGDAILLTLRDPKTNTLRFAGVRAQSWPLTLRVPATCAADAPQKLETLEFQLIQPTSGGFDPVEAELEYLDAYTRCAPTLSSRALLKETLEKSKLTNSRFDKLALELLQDGRLLAGGSSAARSQSSGPNPAPAAPATTTTPAVAVAAASAKTHPNLIPLLARSVSCGDWASAATDKALRLQVKTPVRIIRDGATAFDRDAKGRLRTRDDEIRVDGLNSTGFDLELSAPAFISENRLYLGEIRHRFDVAIYAGGTKIVASEVLGAPYQLTWSIKWTDWAAAVQQLGELTPAPTEAIVWIGPKPDKKFALGIEFSLKGFVRCLDEMRAIATLSQR